MKSAQLLQDPPVMSEIIIEMPPDFSHQVPLLFFLARLYAVFFCGVQRSQEQRNTKTTQMSSFVFFGAGFTDLNHFMSKIFRNLCADLVVGTFFGLRALQNTSTTDGRNES